MIKAVAKQYIDGTWQGLIQVDDGMAYDLQAVAHRIARTEEEAIRWAERELFARSNERKRG